MQVIGNPCAGRLAQIHAQVKSVWMIDVIDGRLHALRQQYHFRGGISFQVCKIRGMCVGNDQYMSGSVRVSIQNDIIFHRALHDEPFLVTIRRGSVAKDATRLILGFGNVLVAPRRPEVIHREYWLRTAKG